MTKLEIRIGTKDTSYVTCNRLDPEAIVTITGEHAFVREILQHLEKFELPVGPIEVR